MPKGVEHAEDPLTTARIHLVHSSVMPKGVEHRRGRQPKEGLIVVHSSVMPKGVEHEETGAVVAVLVESIHP